ncbi:MAG: polysaccharide deacetylase family protein [Rubrobacter sp.]
MVRRIVFVLALAFVLVLALGILVYGDSSSDGASVPSLSSVEAGALPGPPDPPPLDLQRIWAEAVTRDTSPDLAAHGRTGTFGGEVALTFDDGPEPRTTPMVLDTLREHDLKATFFVVGNQVAENPGLLRRIVAEGHILGNHTYTHADMATLDPAGMRRELRSTQEAVDEALGYHYPMVVMRPPYGSPYFDGSRALPAFRKVVQKERLFPVIWTVDPRDYLFGDRPESVVRAVIRADEASKRRERDEVVLLHDSNSQTAQALPEIIDYYEQSDRQFASVRGLLVDKYGDDSASPSHGSRNSP